MSNDFVALMSFLWGLAGFLAAITLQVKLGYWYRFHKDIFDAFTTGGCNLVVTQGILIGLLFKHLFIQLFFSVVLSPLFLLGPIGLGIVIYIPRSKLPQF